MGEITHWRKLEEAVAEYFTEEERWNPMMLVRFYDTASAGRYMPDMPADFLVIDRGQATFFECKFSKAHESLTSCLAGHVRSTQVGSAYVALRAQAGYWFIFYSSVSKRFEAWNGKDVYNARVKDRGRLRADQAYTADTLELLFDKVMRPK